ASPGKSTCPALKPSVLMQSYPAIGLSHSRQGYPLYKPTPVRLRYVPRHPLGFLQTPLLPVAPLPAGYLPAGWAVGFLSTHRLGRHAGRTAKAPPKAGLQKQGPRSRGLTEHLAWGIAWGTYCSSSSRSSTMSSRALMM